MSEDDEPVDTCCASCGIAEIDDMKLKECDGCDLVKYCSDECRENHKSEHEEYCKKRAAELRDELLFKQPESTHLGDCPICCLPMPLDNTKFVVYACCGKRICRGCWHANNTRGITPNHIVPFLPEMMACPFCRTATKSTKQTDKQLMKRAKANDPAALCLLGGKYNDKGYYSRAFECFTKAAELGEMPAHYELSSLYHFGQFVEKDEVKSVHHREEAAIGGHPGARYSLGAYESSNENFERAVKHWIIAATQGFDDSMEMVMVAFRRGLISKEDLASVLRAHKAAVDATRSPQRQAADDYFRNNELLHGSKKY